MKFLYLIPFLITFSVAAKPCGLTGSIEERIKDCSLVKGDFVLVAISERGNEFYKDLKTNLIWGSRISTDFNHYGSQKACAEDVLEYQVLTSMKWRLPTINEFEQAAVHGMKGILPFSENSFWSSTAVKIKRTRRNRGTPASAYIWDGLGQKTDTGDLKDGASVRCVAKE